MSKPDDTLTRRGAEVLAFKIERYWKRRGFPRVRSTAEQFGTPDHWQVRSNLVNGMPPGVTSSYVLHGVTAA